MKPVPTRFRLIPVAFVLLALAACATAPPRRPDAPRSAAPPATHHLEAAQEWARRARHHEGRIAHDANLRCAVSAYDALGFARTSSAAAVLATQCTDALLASLLREHPRGWRPGRAAVGGVDIEVEFRQLSPYLSGALSLMRAQDVPMRPQPERAHDGFGVPLAAISARCTDRAICEFLPPEGVFRDVTAWIEPADRAGAPPRLVLGNALALQWVEVGPQRIALAHDTSAAFARGVGTSKLDRLAIWGLLGGHEVGRRAGVYLLEDYDPDKRPLVMIHGLGSSPLTWARLSDAVWADPQLRARFQVWHVVYKTDAPLLVVRRRVAQYLDEAWSVLDPDGDDPARGRMVLLGHSMGAVIARMLCVETGDVLWDAAFTVPPREVRANRRDVDDVTDVFRFSPYPGVTRAIFIAAPHRGSPDATRWFGRLARVLVGRRAPELQALKRVADSDPQAVQPAVRRFFRAAELNSIATLQVEQPVRAAGQSLLPAKGIGYHTIAGALPGRVPPGDGVVPLESAILPGAESTLVLELGHDLHTRPQGIAEVLRILRESP